MDAPSILAGLTIGGALGVIASRLITASRWRTIAKDALAVADEWRARCRKQGRELAELRAEKQRRLAPLKAANAARKQAKIDRDNASRALRNARHAEMRELVGGII